ncbi:GNAT family N-acetyltransferase [Actinospongicola halichondriae]|uniref:GNAT family N-acetyltransferase n=1 Tax=Actinospongicola halichondriae TaxID=3236844 RepID=UPI003D589A4D
MGNSRVIVHATATDLDDLSEGLAAAFVDDPVQRWLFAGSDDFRGALDRFFRFFVDEYFAVGHVYVARADPGAGGAMWAPPDRDILHDADRLAQLVALMGAEIGEDPTPRLMELARASEYRPAAPHFYLGILGVAPEGQGGGLGASLLDPVLAACDAAGMVAHLESSNPRNLGFYERLGFETVDEYRCGGDPLMTIMSRQPR